MRLLVLFAALCATVADGAPRPEQFTLAESVAAHATRNTTQVASVGGHHVVWDEGGHLLAASAPDYRPRRITGHTGGGSITGIFAAPDGRTIFYKRSAEPDGESSGPVNELWMLNADSGETTRIASGGDVPGGGMVFSPDGAAFAYVKDKALWEFRREGRNWVSRSLFSKGDPRLRAATGVGDPLYSPDGKKLAFASFRKSGPDYIGVMDLGTLDYGFLQPGIFFDVAPAWSPDSRQLVFIRIPRNDPMRYRFSPAAEAVPWSLQLADIGSGEVRTLWRADPGRGSAPPPDLARPLWSRDGRILFLWEKSGWQQLYAIPEKGGTPALLTPGEGEVNSVVLNAAGDKVAYESNIGDLPRQHVWTLSLKGGAPQRLVPGDGREADPVFLADDALAYVANPHGRMPVRRMVNTGGRSIEMSPAPEEMARHRKVWEHSVDVEVVPVAAEDGMVSYHLLSVPKGRPPAGGFPVIVTAKGGPHGRVMPGRGYGDYTPLGQYAASRGYVFVEMNYRGGTGFGLDYRLPDGRGATGGSEVKDVAALARYLKSRPDVDPKRIGIAGHSYGGHMVGLALGRLPGEFAAGIHMSGVADWVIEMKKDGGGSAPSEFIPLSERMRIEDLARASSSTASVAEWRAPTLFIMGELDTQGHMESIIDLGYRLMEQGVETEYYIAHDGVHRLFPLEKMFEFFERRLGAR